MLNFPGNQDGDTVGSEEEESCGASVETEDVIPRGGISGPLGSSAQDGQHESKYTFLSIDSPFIIIYIHMFILFIAGCVYACTQYYLYICSYTCMYQYITHAIYTENGEEGRRS